MYVPALFQAASDTNTDEETDKGKKDKDKKDTNQKDRCKECMPPPCSKLKDTNQKDKCKECLSPPCSKLLLITATAVAAASLCRALQTIFSIYKC